eukprot:ANDGO_04066.mRNA.1 hypothetical protein
MGICASDGVIYDFAGPYTVSRDNFAFGKPTKYALLDPQKMGILTSGHSQTSSTTSETYDGCIEKARVFYCEEMYNFCGNNCHSFCARALNHMNYKNKSSWTMVSLCILITLHGRFISWAALFKTYAGFLILSSIAVFAWGMTRV